MMFFYGIIPKCSSVAMIAFFFEWAVGLLCIIGFRFVVAFMLDDTVFLFHLGDVKCGDFQTAVFQPVFLNLLINRLFLSGDQIKILDIEFDVDMCADAKFGQKCNHFRVCSKDEHYYIIDKSRASAPKIRINTFSLLQTPAVYVIIYQNIYSFREVKRYDRCDLCAVFQ